MDDSNPWSDMTTFHSVKSYHITSQVSFLFTALSHWYPQIICNKYGYVPFTFFQSCCPVLFIKNNYCWSNLLPGASAFLLCSLSALKSKLRTLNFDIECRSSHKQWYGNLNPLQFFLLSVFNFLCFLNDIFLITLLCLAIFINLHVCVYMYIYHFISHVGNTIILIIVYLFAWILQRYL